MLKRFARLKAVAILAAAVIALLALPLPAQAASQTVPLAMVYYGTHNEAIDNQILRISPEVLIDNTPAAFWHGNCDSAKFQAAGIKVYSYIHGSYSTYSLSQNLAFIDAIAAEGTYGVFLDELSATADSYLQSIYARCRARGLKLMVNPGMPNFDTNIYNYADFVMTDEHYQGRSPSASERGHLDKTVVVGFNTSWSAAQAASYSNAAWAQGFKYTWHEQVEYVSLPSSAWLDSYTSLLNRQSTPAPMIAASASRTVTPEKVTVNFTTNPAGSEVWVGGVFRGYAPLRLDLAPGTYFMGFWREGYTSLTRELAANVTVPASGGTISGDVLNWSISVTPSAP